MDLSRTHIEILFTLEQTGQQPVSEVGKRLYISKPHMTNLVDKLTDEGFIARNPDQKDRRIINIELTESGSHFLSKFKDSIRERVKGKLSALTEEDLDLLARSLENIKKVLSNIKPE